MFDPMIALVGLVVGFLVGMTGIGGGALTTPLLILVFKVPAFAAVGSDLVASLVMKLTGSAAHLGKGTVQRSIVWWLSLGSMPGAFAGVVILQSLDRSHVEGVITRALGFALILAALMTVLRPRADRRSPRLAATAALRSRRAATVLLGAVVGVAVGITSVGSGSLVIVSLLLLYPHLRSAELVGTDLVQATLLVGSAAVGHLLFGEVRFGLASSLIVGAVPGVLLGVRVSLRAPDRVLRPTLVGLLALTGLRMV